MTFMLEKMPELNDMEILLNVDTSGVKTTTWIEQHKNEICELLDKQGALLIRGLNVMSSKQFGQLLQILFDEELASYGYRSTPRTELKGNVYTATEYHPDETIAQHNESSYANAWAMKIGFLCLLPAAEGGATPLADSRLIYQQIPAEIREKFEQKQVMYVRNYGDIDLPWQEVFQTEDKAEVEKYCQENALTFEWREDNRLTTRQVNPAVATHPRTGEKVWFNQAHLFHVSNMGEEARESMLSVFGEQGLPRNAYYGDGSPLEPEVLQIIRDVYAANTVHFDWQRKDVMLLDNMLFTHGRQPFKGDRKVLVGMAQGYSHQ